MNAYLAKLQTSPTRLMLAGTIMSLLFLNACTPTPQDIACDIPKIDTQQVKLDKTETIDLSVYLDGTVSMLGYVQAGNSRYKKFLDALDSVALSRWSQQPSKYFRFGTTKNSIDRNTYRQASLPNFYQRGAGYESSRIDQIIAPPTDTAVSLIITDLYQKDADVQLVQSKLTQQYLDQGYAVGVLGIKSEFKGTIYDVGPSNQQFTYSTQEKQADKFHPFYVLILGSHGNVSHLYDRLRDTGLEDHSFSVFFPMPVSQVATINASDELDTPRELKVVKALNDGKSIVKVGDRDPIQLLMATRKKDAPITFQPTLTLPTLSHVVPIDSTSIAVKPSIGQYKNKSTGFESINTQSIQMSGITIDQQNLNFTGEIDTENLDKGLYQATFELFAQDFHEPDWWSTWSSGLGGTDGSKTNNLRPFLQVLKRNTADIMGKDSTPIAKICYGIQHR